MTVSTQVSRNEYTGNGATTQYDFTFRILDKSHLLVQTLDTSESIVTLTLGTDYTVTGVNRYNGGKVVLTSALPAGYKISIERSTPVTQESSIRNQGGFLPEIHEDAFDKLTMIIQRMYGWWSGLALKKPSWLANYYDAMNNRIRNLRDPSLAQDAATKSYVDSSDIDLQQQITSNFNRSLRVPDSYISQLPSAQDRAWKGLGFDGAGQPKLQDPAGTGLWGYVPAVGSFEHGSILTQRFEVLLWESTNEYWRWDGVMPKVVLPGSTPATAGGTGKGKWIDVTDATLRSNLGSGDGQKLVGKCATLDALRTTEPEYHGQEIILFRAVDDGPVLNERLYYDATDTTSEENGFSVFVTPNGARWKPVDSSTINVWLAGFNPDTNNLAACINKICQWYVTKSIEDGQINNRKAVIFVPSLGYKTTYIITETIKLPPALVELRTAGDMIFDFSSIPNVDGIVCSHEYPGLTYGMGGDKNGYSADSGGYVINPAGVLYVKGAGVTRSKDSSGNVTSTAATTGVGIVLGNRTRTGTVNGYLNVRDTSVRNVRVFGFTGGFQFGTCDTYLVKLEDSNLYANLHNHYQPNMAVINSGEGMYFDHVTVSNAGINNHYIDVNGLDYWFKNTHIDYAYQDGVFFGPNAATEMILTDCWLEGNDRYVFAQPKKTGTSGQCRILMQGGKIVPNRYGVTYRGVRPIFKAPGFNFLILELMDVDMSSGYAGYMCDDAYGTWVPYGDQTTLIIRYRVSDIYKWLPRFVYGAGGYLLNSNYTFTGSAGTTLPSSVSTANLESAYHWSMVTGGATVEFGAAADADSDGLIPVKITAKSTSDIVYLFCANYVQFPRNGVYMRCKGSVKCAAAVGSVNVQAVLRPLTYRYTVSTLNTSNNEITNNYYESSLGNVAGDTIDVLGGILTQPYLTRTPNDYVSTPPLKIQNYFKGSLWGNPGLKFTGFTGTIYVKLPAYWFEGVHPNW